MFETSSRWDLASGSSHHFFVQEKSVVASLKILRGESDEPRTLRIGSRLDKYRLMKRMGEGGFATVFAARDMIVDRKVALKIPASQFVSQSATFEDMKREVRIMARLDHPGILPLQDARFIDGHFVMVFPLGQETLEDRMTRRMSRSTAIQYLVQMVSALSYAHQHSVLHRDIKPENFVLFSDQTIQLSDFGLARIEKGGHEVSASGTLGYMAPEQAMGKPSYRSDVFSLGLVIYRMLAGDVPEYPFDSFPGFNRLRRGISQELVSLIRKSIDPSPRKRFRDGVAMENALSRIRFPLTDRSVVLRGSTESATLSARRVA
ncbi:serine/threonine protein kinase [bacterium]|nr:serine/threonine protein kinase [bacterium]